MRTIANSLLISIVCIGWIACAPTESPIDQSHFTKADPGKADSSSVAVFLDFEFDGELVTGYTYNVKGVIEDQLLYTVGQLNGDRSVSRIDRLELTNIQKTQTDDGKFHVTYHAKTVVAWGKKNSVPQSYSFVLPKDMSYDGQKDFIEKYSHDCVDWGAHDVDSGTMWYYWRPHASRCDLEQGDTITADATVDVSEISTTGKFPEYDKVWEDEAFKVVAVFGKYEDGATSGDSGISAYNRFVSKVKSLLGPHNPTTTPDSVPSNPGVDVPDIEFRATLDGGRTVEIVALLVDSVRSAGQTFNKRYEALSSHADLIAYNGHSGLGANIRALARKGKWIQGQYVVVFMNGCDTYAYVDSALADAHAQVNPDDPKGTKYVDVVTNAMPSFFSNMASATMALIRGLMAHDAPKTYEKIFEDISSSQVVLVSGEEDNTYVPGGGGGGGGGGGDPWSGMSESGTVAKDEEKHYATPELKPGRYIFTLSGDNDADLYVRIGEAPTKALYDCRPYKYGSAEACKVELPSAAKIHVMVRGWAQSSSFQLVGQSE
jgi:hypothetical protein